MLFQNKPVSEITEADLKNLINNHVCESRVLDYKQECAGNSREDRIEFLADVSAFANTSGGFLVFGVKEDHGEAVEMCGLPGVNRDKEIGRLEQMIQSGIDERIIGIRFHTLPISPPRDGVIIVEIPKSFNGPHRVTFDGHAKFYARGSNRKYPMDVVELRNAFALSASVSDRMSRFRAGQLSKVISGDTPIPVAQAPTLVLHLIPFRSFEIGVGVDTAQVRNTPKLMQLFHPLVGPAFNFRYNFDGLINHGGIVHGGASSYVQLFRSGIVEAVDTSLLDGTLSTRLIPSHYVENECIKCAYDYLLTLQQLGIECPIVLAVSLLGVKGLSMATRNRPSLGVAVIDRDHLLLPEEVLMDFPSDVPTTAKLMKPMFDVLWQSAGYAGSENYDESGNWRSNSSAV